MSIKVYAWILLLFGICVGGVLASSGTAWNRPITNTSLDNITGSGFAGYWAVWSSPTNLEITYSLGSILMQVNTPNDKHLLIQNLNFSGAYVFPVDITGGILSVGRDNWDVATSAGMGLKAGSNLELHSITDPDNGSGLYAVGNVELTDGCLMFNDSTIQCTAASGSGGNASIQDYGANNLTIMKNGTELTSFAGYSATACSVANTFYTGVNISANGTLTATCTGVSSSTVYIPYTGGSATKLTTNVTTDYMLVGTGVMSATHGLPVTTSRRCSTLHYSSTISAYALTGVMNFTAVSVTTLGASTTLGICSATVTGNGEITGNCVASGGTPGSSDMISLYQRKQNGTFQATNTMITLMC